MIGWALVAFSSQTVFPGLSALLPCLGACLLIVTAAHASTPVSRLLSLSPLVFIGKISYSLYLWHWPIIVFFRYTTPAPPTLAQSLACVAGSFLLAALSWRFIEQPFRRRPDPATRPRVFAGAGAAMIATLLAGGVVLAGEGFPARLPPDIVALLDRDALLHDRRDCHFVTPKRATRNGVCQRGAEGTAPTFVFAGDSHADAVSPAVFEAARQLGLSGLQYTAPGFRPLKGITKRGAPDFQAETDAFIEFLQSKKHLHTIVLTGFWSLQATGKSYRHESEIWLDEDYDGSGTGYNRAAFSNGLARLVRALPGRRFVLLDDVPSGAALDLRNHLRERLYGPRDIDKLGGLAREDYRAQRQTYEDILRAVAAAHPNVSYRAVFAHLCAPSRCPLFSNGQPLFRDGDHLSPHGAGRMVPALQRALSALMVPQTTAQTGLPD